MAEDHRLSNSVRYEERGWGALVKREEKDERIKLTTSEIQRLAEQIE